MSQELSRVDLASAAAYATPPDRIRRRDELFAILDQVFAQQPWSYWQQRMRSAGVPCGQVRSVSEAVRSPEARERQLVTRIPHPQGGWAPMSGCQSAIHARRSRILARSGRCCQCSTSSRRTLPEIQRSVGPGELAGGAAEPQLPGPSRYFCARLGVRAREGRKGDPI
jgi:hypothetical protein